MRRPVLFALVIALLAAGCGASNDSAADFEGAEQDVARAIEDLEEAAQEEEPRRICEALLSRSVRDRLGRNCERMIEQAIDQTDTFALTVESVRVTGNTARARVETGLDEEQIEVIELVREENAWRIAGFPGS